MQWTKNIIIFAAFVFALGDPSQHIGIAELIRTVLATGLFCLLSSAVYLINDAKDVEADRLHPKKRFRPIAAGEVSITGAIALAIILLTGTLIGFYLIATKLFLVAFGYLVLQIAYTFGLKRIALADLFGIAGGFVLRALAGAVAINLPISPWLLLCTMLLAIFLALCKRRHEKIIVADSGLATRANLEKYDKKLLDQLISIVSSAVIVCYALYTLWPDTVAKFGTTNLAFTIPFVIFGIFRYLDLVYRHEKGERPEKILLTDVPIICCVVLYGLTVMLILLMR